MKKLLSIIALFIFIFTGCSSEVEVSEGNHINYKDALSLEGDYFVYYYQPGCGGCEAIKEPLDYFEEVLTTNTDMELYKVDLSLEENQDAWYDWDYHNQNYEEGDLYSNPDLVTTGMTNYKDIVVAGTPTLIYVSDGVVEKFAYDVDEVIELMTEMINTFGTQEEIDKFIDMTNNIEL